MAGAPFRQFAREWPTWIMLALCYGIWLGAVFAHETLGWFWLIPATLMVTLHSSLQHEALHGHPTRSCWLNEALVFPALGLFVPYGRFKELHLKHHNNASLTDPYDDPESHYVTVDDWHRLSPLSKAVLTANGTLAGRFILGPALACFGLIRGDLISATAGDRAVISAWLRHGAGLIPVIWLLDLAGIGFWAYALGAAYPGMSVLMVRTFIEHRAAEAVPERTAIVEAGWLMRLLFLNNNYHAVHHKYPCTAWFRLPRLWHAGRDYYLGQNGHYHYPGGYLQIAGLWLLRRREPPVHPFLRRNAPLDAQARPEFSQETV